MDILFYVRSCYWDDAEDDASSFAMSREDNTSHLVCMATQTQRRLIVIIVNYSCDVYTAYMILYSIPFS
ncbi:hypothetical protein BRADI_2g22215v3 [Brachypodium distachyon]|uniref:Uncharacterized protein n=1 Tax=Brachypodium distachyon TaxID=15368 RepID=A0A2K2D9T7_BRADI|nr:hypothetical protein BRADI_2g22215v3 [Brachypodium distachyon]